MMIKNFGNFFYVAVMLLAILALLSTAAFGLTVPASMVGKAIVNKGITYTLSIGKYEPVSELIAVDNLSAKNDTPENAAISQLSAMMKKDYNWWLTNWTVNGRFALEQRDKELSRTPAYWINRWSLLDGKKVEIRYRADYSRDKQQFVLIGYGVNGLMIGDKEYESTLVFKNENSKWLATQDLSSDTVFNNIIKLWHTTDSSISLP